MAVSVRADSNTSMERKQSTNTNTNSMVLLGQPGNKENPAVLPPPAATEVDVSSMEAQTQGMASVCSAQSTTYRGGVSSSRGGSRQNAEAERLHTMGYEARKKGDYKTAVQLYTKAIEASDSYFKAYFNRGFAFDKLEEYENAIKDYTKALELEPKNAFVYYNRGISLDKLQRLDEAIYNFSMAITLEPAKADFYHNRGFAYRKKLEYEKALQDYGKAIELAPNHFKVGSTINSGRHTTTGRRASTRWASCARPRPATKRPSPCSLATPTSFITLEQCRRSWAATGSPLQWQISPSTHCMCIGGRAIEMDPKFAIAYNGRGLVLDKLGKYAEALADFGTAIELEKENPVFRNNRACCLRNRGDFKEALEDFSVAINIDPTNPVIYSNRGQVYRKLERFENALEDYVAEIQNGTGNVVKAYTNKAYCNAKLSRYEDAIADYSKVLDFDPNNAHALHNRGISYQRIGKLEQVTGE